MPVLTIWPRTIRFLAPALACAVLAVAPELARGGIYTTQEGVDEGVVFAQTMPEASGYITGDDADFGGAWNIGSMTLIHPEWALTAAHVVDSWSNIEVGFGSNVYTDAGISVTTDERIVHPSYSGTGQGFDLALVHLSTPVTSIQSAVISGVPVSVGVQGFNIGYGYNGVAGASLTFDGSERAGTDHVFRTEFSSGFREYFTTRLDGDGPNSLLEWLAAGGDSGGAFYLSDGNGGYELAGVNSYATGTVFGNSTGFSELDPDWIYKTITGGVMPSLSISEQDGDIVVTMHHLRPGTDYTLRWSSDLENWHLAEQFTAAQDPAPATIWDPVTHTFTEPMPDDTQRFYRLEWVEE